MILPPDMEDNIKRMNDTIKYNKIVEDYGGGTKIAKDLVYFINTLPKLMELITANAEQEPNMENFKYKIDSNYYGTKVLANTANYLSTVMPICRRYFPTEEDKARMLEFIKKMEEIGNDDSESETGDK